MTSRYIKIDNCEKCKHCTSSRQYTSDSFETCFQYSCEKHKKVIENYVSWNESIGPIPDWCEYPTIESLKDALKG